VRRYEGTRLGLQELNADILDDVVGALWKLSDNGTTRMSADDLPTMRRIVVAINPAITSGENSDETGMIVADLGADGRGYALEHRSGKYTPMNGPAQHASPITSADRVIAVNKDGDLVERTVDPNVSFKSVTSSRGKIARAEPIGALYEHRKVSHVGMFPRRSIDELHAGRAAQGR
jgi:phage terminase large subunit-like protein